MLRTRKAPKVIFILTFCLLTLLLWASSAHALMLKMSLEELTEGADTIVMGTVESTSSHWNDDRTSIYTVVEVSVEEGLKNEVGRKEITVIVPGGEAEGIIQMVSDMPNFIVGERVMLFLNELYENNDLHLKREEALLTAPVYSMHGNFQGKLDIIENRIGELSVDKVKDQINSIKKEQGINTESISDDDNPVVVGHSPYVYNGQKWFGDWPVVNFRVNDSGGPAGSSLAVQNAANTWSNAGAKFEFNFSGTHSRTGSCSQNWVNEVTWHDLGSGSTLAYAIWWYYSTGEIFEADMVFNTSHDWSTASQTPSGYYDVETVALHEFGHWLSLDHSSEYNAIMWHSYKGPQRTLHSDDIEGIKYIYGSTTAEPLPDEYELTIEVEGEGTTEPVAGVHVYEEGTEVLLTAEPEEGWEFEKWLVNGIDIADSTVQVTIDGDKTATAYFAQDETSDIVHFADPDLEQSIRDELNKPSGDITKANMEEITFLNAADKGIEDLTGLEYAANLQNLYVQNNQLRDISVLANLTNLQVLEIQQNHLDISEGSAILKMIQQMIDDGINVEYEPQKKAEKGAYGSGFYNQDNGRFALKDGLIGGVADYWFTFGSGGDSRYPAAGDWNGDGKYGIGFYNQDNGRFALKDGLTGGAADYWFTFGSGGDSRYPAAGDWNGDGKYGIGFYNQDNGRFALKDGLTGGAADYWFTFGNGGESLFPVVGDWNGDGKYGIGFYNQDNGRFALKDGLTGGAADYWFTFGNGGKSLLPVSGIW